MLMVEEYGRIRRAHRDGMSIREIARQFHHSRSKVRAILHGGGEPVPYARRREQCFPKLGVVKHRLLEILAADESQPPKQRHTAMRLFERLREEHGYQGGYDTVRKFVKRHRQRQRETFIPLDHDHGRRMEADFGKIYVDFPDGRRQVSVLILVWSCSNAPFAMALPTERTEAILEGMQQGFEFFGKVPREVWWDNPKTVAETLLTGRDRKINPRYAAFASHYAFEPLFCLPASGNEKPVVENRVKTLQRRWGTPVPRAGSMQELNDYLRQCCLNDQSRPATATGQTAVSKELSRTDSEIEQQTRGVTDDHSATPERTSDSDIDRTPPVTPLSKPKLTVGDVLVMDLRTSAALPRHPFEACVRQSAKVDKYQMVRFDNVGYSVPRHMAFQTVTVKGFIDDVEIVHDDAVVARHTRSYDKHSEILDPRHYLNTLERRPAALDHSSVMRDWRLPPAFADLRQKLEQRHGVRSGVRHYVRVLQLLGNHSAAHVAAVIEQLSGAGQADADRIIRRVEMMPAAQQDSQRTDRHWPIRSDVTNVTIPSPGLAHFDSLLCSTSTTDGDISQGSSDDENLCACGHTGSARDPSPESQPETAETADHQPRISQAGSRGGHCESDVRTVPAETDGTGSHHPPVQCTAGPHQTGGLSGREGTGQLRLLGDAFAEQTKDPGTGALRMDHETLQHLPAGAAGNRENTSGDFSVGCRLSSGIPSSLLHGSDSGQRAGREAEELSDRSFSQPAGSHRPACD